MDRRKVLAAVCGGLVLTLGGSAVAAGPDDAGLPDRATAGRAFHEVLRDEGRPAFVLYSSI